ncbi:hypothetical protein GFS24_28090 [Chitinophaga sp. SYP-B3965]|uniref:hypothetical protein n=1 Tax=Chitinophaga sp. SYP-B3965 TaxID=2663120 RepID=UPI001299C37C|nr:hypothetical protein [Chitinophaga sp. SYP-B3965]MRG49002.1 hypothetical protein [Chitinophaga sp. SYP-B3965]
MLFELIKQHHPNAIRTSVIPEEYANLALPSHVADVTIDNDCTLIHQTVHERGYNLWVNNFFIHKPLRLHVLPQQRLYSLYYSVENTVKLIIQNKERNIPLRDFCLLDLPRGQHFGDFEKGTYRSLHITVDEQNKSILKDPAYAAALLREYYFDAAF